MVDALVGGSSGRAARAALSDTAELPVPAVFPAEVASAVRRLTLRGDVSAGRAAAALAALRTVRLVTYPFLPFLDRAWELRSALTTYEAWYVALAEALGASLLTADRRLAAAHGPRLSLIHI